MKEIINLQKCDHFHTPVMADLLKMISIGFIACGLIFKDSRILGVEESSEKP